MPSVVITNKTDEDYTARFDGTVYAFPVDKPVTIPEAAAAFIFAYGMDDAARQRILIRNNWLRNGMPGDPFGPEAAMKRLQGFVFKKGPEDAKKAPPEKLIAPSQMREMTGINAVSPGAIERAQTDGKTIVPRTLRLPGAPGPMLPPA